MVRFAVGVAVTLLVCATAVPAYADDDGSYVSIGVDWVGTYAGTGAPASVHGNLASSQQCVEGLKRIVDDPATSWRWQFDYGNASAWELDWKRTALGGSAYRLCDDVDLVAFAGHGYPNALQFAAKKSDWQSTPSDMDLGVRDAEWALTYTCNFLKGTPADFGSAANGVHLICGYATDMTLTPNGGEIFSEYAKPHGTRQAYGVRVAWYKYGQATQSWISRNVARTFGAKTAVNDFLWGYGPVAADPPAYSSSTAGQYAYWDTDLNF